VPGEKGGARNGRAGRFDDRHKASPWLDDLAPEEAKEPLRLRRYAESPPLSTCSSKKASAERTLAPRETCSRRIATIDRPVERSQEHVGGPVLHVIRDVTVFGIAREPADIASTGVGR
jgi:hypothetical protein